MRCAAIAVIEAWQLPEVISLLKPLCQDGELIVRAAVAAALGEFGGDEAKAALESIDASGEWAVEAAVQAAMRQFQPEAIPDEATEPEGETARQMSRRKQPAEVRKDMSNLQIKVEIACA